MTLTVKGRAVTLRDVGTAVEWCGDKDVLTQRYLMDVEGVIADVPCSRLFEDVGTPSKDQAFMRNVIRWVEAKIVEA